MPASPRRILAVDDLRSNLLLIESLLRAPEFEVVGCTTADEARSRALRETWDLLILDVVLPDLDGYALARSLRELPGVQGAPVIFLTSLNTEAEVVKGFDAGAVDFVSRPFHPAELLARVRTHLALRDRSLALEAAAQSRDRFFSILAHDLKNPLSGFQSLVREVVDSFERMDRAELFDILKTVEVRAGSVYRLLETLLDWGRAQTGALTLDPQPQFLRFLVDEAAESVEDLVQRKGITLDTGEVSLQRAVADRYTVVAILRNLLSNAAKFTPRGGRITVRGSATSAAAWIEVEDTGVGIAAERLPGLFRLDTKVSTPGTDREPGSGLGLALCAEFARQNQGQLEVLSVVGQGSLFRLKLPLASED